jgi:hypothetical protein
MPVSGTYSRFRVECKLDETLPCYQQLIFAHGNSKNIGLSLGPVTGANASRSHMNAGLSPSVPGLFTPRLLCEKRLAPCTHSTTSAATALTRNLGSFERLVPSSGLVVHLIAIG